MVFPNNPETWHSSAHLYFYSLLPSIWRFLHRVELSGILLLPMLRSSGKKKDACHHWLLWPLPIASLEKRALWLFCLCLSNWQPFLFMEMSDPASLLTARLGLRVSLLARSWPGAKPFFHPPLCLFLSLCVDEHELPPISYLYKVFWGRQPAGSRCSRLVLHNEEARSGCSASFVGDFEFLVRLCSRAHVWAWVWLWGGTLVPSV